MPEAPIDEAEATLQGCEALELAWNTGKGTPRWEDYLPGPGRPWDVEQVFLLIQLDIEFRARAGLTGLLGEGYLQHPRLKEANVQFTDEQKVELIRWEYQQRWKNGDRAPREDYLAAFPQQRAQLQNLRPRWTCPKCRRASPVDNEASATLSCGGCGSTFDATEIFRRRPVNTSSGATPDVPGYAILAPLGEGGMGVVYKARQLGLNRIVALKMIRSGDVSKEMLARFRAEGEAVARLQHPNIVQIFDVGEHNGLPFFSLEYVEGGSLDKHLAGQPQPPAQAAQLVQTLAAAMQVAHDRGLVHRDLKPANVLLKDEGGRMKDEKGNSSFILHPSAFPKITDFGLVKQLDADSSQTRTGLVMGSPSYMAPEQALGRTQEIRAAADIYSLGAILYELLTGRPPFRGASLLETLEQVRTLEPVRPSLLQPKLPRDLETICLKCLDKEPSGRYATSQALADDLGRWRRGEPILARRPWPGERMLKWVRRKPVQAVAILACILAVAAGATAYAIHRHSQIQQAEDHFKIERNEANNLAQRFGKKMKAVLPLHTATLTPFPTTTDRESVGALIQDALAEYHLNQLREKEVPAKLREQVDYLDNVVRAELLGNCLVMLVAWADTEASASTALAIIERAEVVDRMFAVNSKALPLRRKHYEALQRGEEQDIARTLKMPDDNAGAQDWFLAALDFYRAGRFDEAGRACVEMRKRRSQDFWADYLEGLCYLQTRRWAKAQARLSSAITLEETFLWSYMQRGYAASELGHQPGQPPELAHEFFNEAKGDFAKVLSADAPTALRFLTLTNRGVLFVRQEQWKLAINDLQQAVKLEPQSFIAHANLAQALQGDKQWEQAESSFADAIKRSPPQQLGALHESRALFHRKRLEHARAEKDAIGMTRHRQAAIDDLEKALTLEPDADRRLQDLFDLGLLYQDQGDLRRSLDRLNGVVALDPDHRVVHQLRGEILLKLQRHQEAGQALDRHLQVNVRPTANVCVARALIHLEFRQLGPAVDRLTQALGIEPNVRTQRLRGWAHLMLDSARPALEDFQACLKKDTDDVDALIGRGLAHARMKKVNEALQDAARIEKIGPHTSRDLYNLACLYAQLVARLREEQATPDTLVLVRMASLLEKATRRLDEAVQLTPLSQRASFWRQRVADDPFLVPIRRSEGYLLLAAKYAGPNL